MPARDALQRRQFGPPARAISPDEVVQDSRRLLHDRHALLEKPGEIVRRLPSRSGTE